MRALLLQYIQTRESRAISTPAVRRLCQDPAKRKNVSARVINRDRSDQGEGGGRSARALRLFT